MEKMKSMEAWFAISLLEKLCLWHNTPKELQIGKVKVTSLFMKLLPVEILVSE